MSCTICGHKDHNRTRCGKVKSILVKWDKFTDYGNFEKKQKHLVPSHYRSIKNDQTVGPCQGWYALESSYGIHYIGIVGRWNSRKQNKANKGINHASQSENTFFRRWTQDQGNRKGHDTKGGFGDGGNNGTWPKKALQQGKLIGKGKCTLYVAPVNTIDVQYSQKGKKPNFNSPGKDQAELIGMVEEYLIHRYANRFPQRKTNTSTKKKSIITSKYNFRTTMQKDTKILFNVQKSLPKKPYNATVKTVGLPKLNETNKPLLTMINYLENHESMISTKPKAKAKAKSKPSIPRIGLKRNPYPNLQRAKNGRNNPKWYFPRGKNSEPIPYKK